jgi:SARP family transcriptional regulator, regulator of embCAB operon
MVIEKISCPRPGTAQARITAAHLARRTSKEWNRGCRRFAIANCSVTRAGRSVVLVVENHQPLRIQAYLQLKEAAMIKFQLLGLLELRNDGIRRSVRSPSQAILLLSLLLTAGRRITTDALINELWGGTQPNRPDNALQAHLSRLRALVDSLEADRTTSRLISGPAGYQLRVSDDEIDGHAFLTAASRLCDSAATLTPTEVTARARQALALWRGPLFGGVSGGTICHSGAVRYERARYRVLEVLFEAELAYGNHAQIVPDLSALVATPTIPQTRFCEQLMIALYRSGRQADALEVFYRTRQRVGEIGLQHLARLKTCTQAILQHDQVLLHGHTDEIIRRLQTAAGGRPGLPRRLHTA